MICLKELPRLLLNASAGIEAIPTPNRDKEEVHDRGSDSGGNRGQASGD